MKSEQEARAIPVDYDDDPERFRAVARATERYALVGDVHEDVADRLSRKGHEPALDLGCGDGRLISLLRQRDMQIVGLDSSPTMLSAASGPRARGDATLLPFRNGSFTSVAALYMLYHLPDPRRVIAEAYRVMRRGGLFVACAPSRYNDPELASVLPQSPMTFDAENGPELVGEFFTDVEVERWDGPLVHLPDRDALTLYLYGHGLARLEAEKAWLRVSTPLTITKRGALIYAYKRS
jgi:SAM-dependent methyltransferase